MSEKGNQNPNLKGSDTDVVWPESEEELNATPDEIKQKMIARQIEQKKKAREERRRKQMQIVRTPPIAATTKVLSTDTRAAAPSGMPVTGLRGGAAAVSSVDTTDTAPFFRTKRGLVNEGSTRRTKKGQQQQ